MKTYIRKISTMNNSPNVKPIKVAFKNGDCLWVESDQIRGLVDQAYEQLITMPSQQTTRPSLNDWIDDWLDHVLPF